MNVFAGATFADLSGFIVVVALCSNGGRLQGWAIGHVRSFQEDLEVSRIYSCTTCNNCKTLGHMRQKYKQEGDV